MAQTRSFCNKSIVHVPLHVELSIEVKAKCYQTKYETEQRLYMFSHPSDSYLLQLIAVLFIIFMPSPIFGPSIKKLSKLIFFC